MAKLDGRVVFITGVARGQGRAHAVTCAKEGATIIGVDICAQIASVDSPMSTEADLEQTEKIVSDLGALIMTRVVDTRDRKAVRQVVDDGVTRFGRLDGVVANAGIMSMTGDPGFSENAWHDALAVNLGGTRNTIDAALPHLIEAGRGGSIAVTSSVAGIRAFIRDINIASAGYLGYTTAKHGLIGLMKAYALAVGTHNIRVNALLPTGVNTLMCVNDQVMPYLVEHQDMITQRNTLPVELIEAQDVAQAALWLLSDDSRFVTGVALPIDAGCAIR